MSSTLDFFWSPSDRAPSSLGEVRALDQHRLGCGDSTDPRFVRSVLGDLRPHLMVTDPPYGVDYDPAWRAAVTSDIGTGGHALGRVENDHRCDWTAAWRLFGGDVAYVWHAALHGHIVRHSLEAERFEIRSQIVWDKGRLVISRGHYHWRHECCWYAVRKGATAHWTGDRSQSTVWMVPHLKNDTGHGTQKPIRLMRKAIENNSMPRDVVYDPFMGSGSTLLAAEQAGRICCGLELKPAYVDVAVSRWERATGKTAVRL